MHITWVKTKTFFPRRGGSKSLGVSKRGEIRRVFLFSKFAVRAPRLKRISYECHYIILCSLIVKSREKKGRWSEIEKNMLVFGLDAAVKMSIFHHGFGILMRWVL